MKQPPRSIVAVKNKYQVVIPQRLCEELGINRGDLLEAKVERGKLTDTPKTVLDRMIPASKSERERFLKQLRDEAPEWLKETWAASKSRGTDRLTKREINAGIAASRRTSKKKIKSSAR